jgi:arginine decarboxylase-like protein
MMKNDNLNTLFKNLEKDFDIETPSLGHQQRFLDKLNRQTKTVVLNTKPQRSIWRPLISIAASVAILISLFVGFQQDSSSKDLASISPEMATTQDFFTNAITSELEKLNSEETPEFQDLIVDALFQIKILEENYELLKIDLNDSGNDKRVIYAMIANFQTRIDVLQNVLQHIEDVKQLKNNTYENSSII